MIIENRMEAFDDKTHELIIYEERIEYLELYINEVKKQLPKELILLVIHYELIVIFIHQVVVIGKIMV
ncbi:hypothetical protein P344_00505 [Spiroplasma mirum ATCC 29335]|uniref:Uncharacterized protein n=1 Tax=Spiroplasma mirum ATCC 29335 TaxID=838561 RepID=W6AUW3_9MOLU|nr:MULTISPECIES: hypothetical protein [Spiroplasma]AHI57474.1 hypothetical protein P344_00505 [Spiroplasma mirum ATCC 29335]